jgi:hypothetical protein
MTRLLFAALAALTLVLASPVLAGDCHGDCANCPHKASAPKGETAKQDPAPCACSGKECKCAQGCKCDHCAHKDEKAPKAAPPAKT